MREKLGDVVLGLVLFGGLFCILFVPRVIYGALFEAFPRPTILSVGVLFAGLIITFRVRSRAAFRRIEAWVSAGNWISVPVDRSWPWASLVRASGSVVVDRAWQSMVDDLTVTAGELHWSDNALDGAVVGWAGKGAFVVVHLPVEIEPMGIRRPHRAIGTSHRLDRPALNDAFENGEVPPFTATDRSLFTFEAFKGRLRPEAVDSLIQRTLHLVHLLDLGPDR
jgi:hypothetical protein